MVDTLVLLMSVIVGLLILRSLGGDGLNIKFQLAPISSSKGRRDHVTVWIALSTMFMGIAYYFIRQRDAEIMSLLVMSFTLGAGVSMLAYLKNRQ